MALLEVKLRPLGPWRIGHRTGDRERVEAIYHSDALFSAVTHAMRSLGWLEEWLDATVRSEAEPFVRFSSLFPFAGNTRLVPPPKTSWPPAAQSRLYLRGAKLVPVEIALGNFDENRYAMDGESGCLIPGGASAPFQVSLRSSVAVDRLNGMASEAHKTACLEFHPRAGWWGLADIANLHWETRVRAAFRLLADSGFGGERSRGWGRAAEPEFQGVTKLFPPVETPGAWWLLSMYSPHPSDSVDWTRGEYSVQTRGGWTDSPSGVAEKKAVRMVEEGSVLAAHRLRGQAIDVAPDGFAHPVYRCGFALAIPIALAGLQVVEHTVEPVAAPVVSAPVVAAAEPLAEAPGLVAEAPEPVVEAPEPVLENPGTAEDILPPAVGEAAAGELVETAEDIPPTPETIAAEEPESPRPEVVEQAEPAEATEQSLDYPDPDKKQEPSE